MKKYINGVIREMTAEELAQMEANVLRAKIDESSRPLTLEEVQKIVLKKMVNSLDIPDATASRMTEYFPTLKDYPVGALITAGMVINDDGVIKRASVDLWNTPENSPDYAPTLWSDIAYRDGIRIIPETISAEQAFALDELGWQDGNIYKSLMDGNVYPVAQADAWVMVR